MGYRHYFVLLDKEIPDKIKDLSKKDFIEHEKARFLRKLL